MRSMHFMNALRVDAEYAAFLAPGKSETGQIRQCGGFQFLHDPAADRWASRRDGIYSKLGGEEEEEEVTEEEGRKERGGKPGRRRREK